jgi:hypothetical protein
LEALEQVLLRLNQHHLKINLDKCLFGNQQVSYLGFTLTPEEIKPGEDKLKSIQKADPPKDVKEIRSFMGLCNFFRNHILVFAITTAPLFKLTRQDSGYLSGPLPTTIPTGFQDTPDPTIQATGTRLSQDGPELHANYESLHPGSRLSTCAQPWLRKTKLTKFRSFRTHPDSSRRMIKIT